MMANIRRFRPRTQVRFWLYDDLQSEQNLIEIITYWKARKQFATMIKAGMRLMWSLGQGKLDVLFDLFPQIETQLAARYSPPTPPDTSALEKKIERLERLIMEQGSLSAPPANYPQLKSPAPVAAVVAAKAVSASTISDNFLSSMGF